MNMSSFVEPTLPVAETVADTVAHIVPTTPAAAPVAPASSLMSHSSFPFVVAFIEALNNNDETNMRIAIERLVKPDERTARELFKQYRAWKDKQTGWTDLYTRFQKACKDQHQAQAAGYLSRIHQKFPQREAAARTEFDQAFPKK